MPSNYNELDLITYQKIAKYCFVSTKLITLELFSLYFVQLNKNVLCAQQIKQMLTACYLIAHLDYKVGYEKIIDLNRRSRVIFSFLSE